jgi:hypothetical protein
MTDVGQVDGLAGRERSCLILPLGPVEWERKRNRAGRRSQI